MLVISFRSSESICQFRLDLDVFVISDADASKAFCVFTVATYSLKLLFDVATSVVYDGLSTYGSCLKDTFQIWTAGGSKIPALCGTNSGYHSKTIMCMNCIMETAF